MGGRSHRSKEIGVPGCPGAEEVGPGSLSDSLEERESVVVFLGAIILEGRWRTGPPKGLAQLGWERGRAQAVDVLAVESFEVGVAKRAKVDRAQNGKSADG